MHCQRLSFHSLWLWSLSFIQVLLKSHTISFSGRLFFFLFLSSKIKTGPNQCFQANPLDPFPHENLDSVRLLLLLCFLLHFLLLSTSSDSQDILPYQNHREAGSKTYIPVLNAYLKDCTHKSHRTCFKHRIDVLERKMQKKASGCLHY